eukprot:5034956-Prymnesium_polylepis.1
MRRSGRGPEDEGPAAGNDKAGGVRAAHPHPLVQQPAVEAAADKRAELDVVVRYTLVRVDLKHGRRERALGGRVLAAR